MRGEAAAKYGPALLTAPLGAIDPIYASIAFGMITGWLAIAGVMYEQGKTFREIVHAVVVSFLIGGGGALFAAFAAHELKLDPMRAAIVAFAIAFGGVKAIKLLAGTALSVINWTVGKLVDDAAAQGRKRQEAHKMMLENTKRDRARLRGDGDKPA